MSLAEAAADGVRYEKRGRNTMFHPRCFFCLREVNSISYISKRHYVCGECKPQIKLFKEYYDDHESKNLFEAISRKTSAVKTQSSI